MDCRLPHRPPCRMISSLEKAEGDLCICTAHIPPESPYVCDGRLLPEMLVEIMAQCFASGAAASAGELAGFLASVDSLEIEDSAGPGETLLVQCSLLRQMGPVALLSAEVRNQAGRRLAAANFKIFIEDRG